MSFLFFGVGGGFIYTQRGELKHGGEVFYTGHLTTFYLKTFKLFHYVKSIF